MRTQDELLERFNDLLDLRADRLECGDGWIDIIWEALEKIEKCEKPSPDWKIQIIKEKFGGLRIQSFGFNQETDDIINLAERKSAYVCEVCGSNTGTHKKKNGWLKTICDKCDKYHDEKGVYPLSERV